MEELVKLCNKLVKSGKDQAVRVALETLLLAPSDLDLQIDVLGVAHWTNWLPNRKKVFWRAFPINSEQWVNRCITRILTKDGDVNALCALLNSEVLAVAPIVQSHSPHLVTVWDVKGAEFCGIGLANYSKDQFDRYFYIGWKVGHITICRLDFMPRILTPPGRGVQRLDHIMGQCEMLGGLWAELPYGFGYWYGQRKFAAPYADMEPQGFTEFVQNQLGYQNGLKG